MNEEMPSLNSGEDTMNTKTEWKIIPQHCQNIRSHLAPVVISDSLILNCLLRSKTHLVHCDLFFSKQA